MWPKTFIELAGFVGLIAGSIFAALQGIKWLLNERREARITNAEIDNKKIDAQISKVRENLLTASQVANLIKATEEVKEDIVQIKEANTEKDERIIKAMDKLESNLKGLEKLWIESLVMRVSEFDKSLMYPKKEIEDKY